MPELPEVETTVRALRPLLVTRRFTEVRNYWPRHLATPDLPELQRRIHGRQVQRIWRRAKYLVFDLSDDETLIIHLKMSGHLSVVSADAPPHKHVRTIFGLDDGRELRFRDQRKWGRVYLVQDPGSVLGGLGPEPLDAAFTAAALAERLAHRRRILKPLLLDQRIIAGIGNIYADEALFYAGIHPARRADTLTPAEIAALHAGIQRALRLGIEREGASIDLYTKPDGTRGDMQNAVMVFRRTGDPCYTCGTAVERLVLGGRSTHICPHCQT
ncbi:MAG: bifunctional DNA-formamidopyrimidine glycosylase/DNA-(apurinic or apyrimidinic site) lyase [Anaerolineales bacterium]|nr:bifunctional DNA-formamidopyrimidine glycosylase/DNA-(apurinic or apyrimidinic site) lyase [Anaerolineales bacterium]